MKNIKSIETLQNLVMALNENNDELTISIQSDVIEINLWSMNDIEVEITCDNGELISESFTSLNELVESLTEIYFA